MFSVRFRITNFVGDEPSYSCDIRRDVIETDTSKYRHWSPPKSIYRSDPTRTHLLNQDHLIRSVQEYLSVSTLSLVQVNMFSCSERINVKFEEKPSTNDYDVMFHSVLVPLRVPVLPFP